MALLTHCKIILKQIKLSRIVLVCLSAVTSVLMEVSPQVTD